MAHFCVWGGFLHEFDQPQTCGPEEFGLGMHYVYDWLDTSGIPKHVIGVDMYVAKDRDRIHAMVDAMTPMESFLRLILGFKPDLVGWSISFLDNPCRDKDIRIHCRDRGPVFS